MDKKIFPPCLVVLAGVPLHGKTALGKKLAEVSNFEHLDVDTARETYMQQLEKRLGKRPDSHSPEGLRLMEDAYAILVSMARSQCAKVPVVITGTFSKDEFKRPLLDFISRSEVPVLVIKLEAELSGDGLAQRIQSREREGSQSPINTPELYLKSVELQTPWSIPVKCINADRPLEKSFGELLVYVESKIPR